MADNLYDYLDRFTDGVDSGSNVLDLPRTKLAYGLNLSVRDGYAHQRPVFIQHQLVFPDEATQQNFQSGFFQEADFYRPDFGASSLVVQIGGRTFELTENTDGTWGSADVSIAGDLNPASANKSWMFQAEKWLIINSGLGDLPLFFDGVTLRRSYGPSVLLGVANAFNPGTPPAIGETVEVTLTAVWTGPFNVPVIMNDEFYQPIAQGGGSVEYTAIIKNPSGGPEITHAIGSDVIIPGSSSSPVTITSSGNFDAVQISQVPNPVVSPRPTSSPGIGLQVSGGSYDANRISWHIPTTAEVTLDLSGVYGGAFGSTIRLAIRQAGVTIQYADTHTESGFVYFNTFQLPNWIVKDIQNGGTRIVVSPASTINGFGLGPAITTNGDSVQITAAGKLELLPGQSVGQTGTQPNVVIGQLTQAATIPVSTTTETTIYLSAPYSGLDNQAVQINGASYTISQAPPPAPSTTLTLINLTDTSAVAYGATEDILSVPELPAGRMGAYGQSHAALSLTDAISFVYGDTVRGPSGTPANNYRDAVLKMTENEFLDAQGAFQIPSSGDIITSMTFVNLLDASLGQGPLQLGTTNAMYSCLVPTDRTTWASLETPILPASLIGLGPINQDSTMVANSDTYFRTPEGISTLLMARRAFAEPGNTPISHEVERVLKNDDKALLVFGSAAFYDNRRMETARPMSFSQGVFHLGSVVINFDPASSIRGKAPAIWEGAWTGLNILKWVVGKFDGVDRCFIFAWNFTDSRIELWELMNEASGLYLDNNVTPVTWMFETAAIFHPRDRSPKIPLVRLNNGRIHLSEIRGSVHIAIYYRPDFYPCWTLWKEFDVCADPSGEPGYASPIGLGEPDITACAVSANRPLRVGRFFQIKMQAAGSFKFMGAEFAASPEPEVEFPPPICSDQPCQALQCSEPDPLTIYTLTGFPSQVTPTPAPEVFFNGPVVIEVNCGEGVVAFDGTLPGWISLDTTNNRVLGAAGSFSGDTLGEANQRAQDALQEFINNSGIYCDATPIDLEDLTTWLKAYDGAYTFFPGTPATNGSIVRYWEDKGTMGFDLDQVANTPIFVTNVQNSLPVIRCGAQLTGPFVTSSGGLLGTSPGLTMPESLVIALSFKSDALWPDARKRVALNYRFSQTVSFQIVRNTDGSIFLGTIDQDTGDIASGFSGGNVPIDTFCILEVLINGAESFIRINGGEKITGDSGISQLSDISVGYISTIFTLPSDKQIIGVCDYGEIARFAGVLTEPQFIGLRRYLSTTWGVPVS